MKKQTLIAVAVLSGAGCWACSGVDEPHLDAAGPDGSATITDSGEGAGFETDEGFADDDAKGVDDDGVGTAVEAACNWRTDFVTSITPGEGFWGNWAQCFDWCDEGTSSFASYAKLKSESPRGGSGDDTGLNAMELTCVQYNSSPPVETTVLKSLQGGWGSWQARNDECGGQPIIGAKMMLEPKQGSGDDTAANRMAFKCASGTWIYPDSRTAWGIWLPAQECPANTAVCGMRTRVEPSQGNGDDSALNGVELACCSL